MKHEVLAHCSRRVYDDHDFTIKNIEIKKYMDTGRAVYVFRGTKGRKDILRDVRFFPWKSEALGAVAPAGFAKAADDICRHIARELPDSTPVILTGHSLGGAIALLAGAMLRNIGHPVELIVTFGSPKVGKLELLRGVPVFMYKNENDPVTKIPLGFGHCRKLIQLRSTKNSWWRWADDHFMDNYVAGIEESGIIS